jgi:hypothetical protein
MSHFPDTYRRPFIASLAVALVLLGGSLGVAKSAFAAAPSHPPAAVERVAEPTPAPERIVQLEATPIRHHFAELEVDSGEVRSATETASLASARRIGTDVAEKHPPRRQGH